MNKKTEQPLILYKKYLHDNQFSKEQPDEIVPVRRHRSLYQVVSNVILSVIVTILIVLAVVGEITLATPVMREQLKDTVRSEWNRENK